MNTENTAQPAPTNGAPPIFNEVIFHIVVSENLSDDIAEKTKADLLRNGAKEAGKREPTALSCITIDLAEVTHIIAADTHFLGYAEAESYMIPVVTPDWVWVSLEKKRIAHVRPFTPDPRFFFSDVIATATELPSRDKEAICGGIIAMGGQFSNNLSKFTTHIVALNLDNEKCQQALSKRLRVKIILPHWFDDCLKLGRRIAEGPYQFPNPEIQHVDSAAPLSMPSGPDLSYTYAHGDGPMGQDPPQPQRDGVDIFKGKKVMLGDDLGITERLQRVLINIIGQAKGSITDDVEEANVYVCHYREGDNYVRASRKSIWVGNLTWLYWMFAHGEWTNPTNRLLHYPLVRGGLPEMTDKVITVSNYGGDARLYLENLIEACGAKFTKSMKADNTHLITARAHSDKCTAAKEWNIHMVNHLWLEDTYAKWQVQSLTNPRYTHFPLRTNLVEVVGQTSIDLDAITRFFEKATVTDDSTPDAVENGVKKKSRIVQAQADKPGTPVPPKRRKTTVEDISPAPPSTGRKAKELATARLHDEIMPDVVLYQKELKRKGGVMSGRWRAGSEESKRSRTASKRSRSPETDEDGLVVKKTKDRPKPTIFLLVTAYMGWSKPQKEEADKRVLADLGIKCVQDTTRCTYLAAPQLVRTEKFCCALARAPIVISTSWVEACVNQKRLVETESYMLKDPVNEKRLSVNLAISIERAKANKGKLLDGQSVFCTQGVHGGFEVCKRIVEANGGVCIMFRSTKRPANAPDSDRIVLLSGDSPPDKKWWPKFQTMAESQGKEWCIYNADWLLETAMNQRVVWGAKYDLSGIRR